MDTTTIVPLDKLPETHPHGFDIEDPTTTAADSEAQSTLASKPECPSGLKCLNCCCCRCCGNRIVRTTLPIFLLVLVFYLFWSIAAAVTLLKIADGAYRFEQTTIQSSICDRRLRFRTALFFDSPSMFSVEVRSLSASVAAPAAKLDGILPGSDRTPSGALGSLSYRKGEQAGDLLIRQGNHSIFLESTFEIADLATLAWVASKTMNNSRVELEVTAEADVYTTAFWIPLTLSITQNMPLVLNAPPEEQAVKGGAEGPEKNATAPLLLSAHIDGIEKPEANIGLRLLTQWRLFTNHTEMPVHLQVPVPLSVQARYAGERIAVVDIQPFEFAPICNVSADVSMAYRLSAQEEAAAQQVLQKYVDAEPFWITVTGAGNGAAQAVLSECMAQEMLDLMPPIFFELGALPVEQADGAESGSLEKDQPPLAELRQIELTEARRPFALPNNSSAGLGVTARLIAQIAKQDFALSAEIGALAMNLSSNEGTTELGFVTASGVSIGPESLLLEGTASLIATDEKACLDALRSGADPEALRLSVTGRRGCSFLSTLLARTTFKLYSDETKEQVGGSTNVDAAGSGMAVEVSVASPPTSLDVAVRLRNISWPDLQFDVFVPGFAGVIRHALPQAEDKIVLEVSTTQVHFRPEVPPPAMMTAGEVHVTAAHAHALGDLVNALVNSNAELSAFRIVAEGTMPGPLSNTRASIDIQISEDDLSLTDSTAALSPTTDSTSEASSQLQVHLLSLDWSDMLYQVQLGFLLLSDVGFTGSLPPLAATVLDRGTWRPLGNVTVEFAPFALEDDVRAEAVLAAEDPSDLLSTSLQGRVQGLSGPHPLQQALGRVSYDFELSDEEGTSPPLASERVLKAGRWDALKKAFAPSSTSGTRRQGTMDSEVPFSDLRLFSTNDLTGAALEWNFDNPLASVGFGVGLLSIEGWHEGDGAASNRFRAAQLDLPAFTCAGGSRCSVGAMLQVAAALTNTTVYSQTIADWIEGALPSLKLTLRGSLGATAGFLPGHVHVQVAVPSPGINLDFGSTAAAGASNASGPEDEEGSGVQVKAVHFLGADGDVPSEPVILPCLVAGTFCSDRAALSATPFRLGIDVDAVSLLSRLPGRWRVMLPQVELNVQTNAADTVTVTFLGAEFTSEDAVVPLDIAIRPNADELPSLRRALTDVVDGVNDLRIRAAGARSAGLLSRLLSAVNVRMTMHKQGSGGTGEQASPPAETFSVSYALAGTTSTSATLRFDVLMENPLATSFPLGQVTLTGSYDGVQVARVETSLDIGPGRNEFTVYATLHGEQPLDKCASETRLPNRAFCKVNEVVSRVISSDSYEEGTAVGVQLSYVNARGQPVVLRAQPIVSSKPSFASREASTSSFPGLLSDFKMDWSNLWSRLWDFATTPGVVVADIIVNVTNPFNFPLQFTSFSTNLYLNDWDGVMIILPAAPDIFYAANSNYHAGYLSVTSGSQISANATTSVPLQATISGYDGFTELAARGYGSYQAGATCAHLRNGRAILQVQYPGHVPCVYTQLFQLEDFEAYGPAPCSPRLCTTRRTTSYLLNSGNMKLNYQAVWSGSTLQLTASSNSQQGTAWTHQRIFVGTSWSTKFTFYTYKSFHFTDWRGDGVAFVIHNDISGSSAWGKFGDSDQNGVVSGVTNGVAFVVSVYEEWIRIHTTNSTGGVKVMHTRELQSSWVDLDEDYVQHTVEIAYDHEQKAVLMTIDGYTSLGARAEFDIERDVPLVDGKAYIGFVASTDRWTRQATYVSSWEWNEALTYLETSFLHQDGLLIGSALSPVRFELDARDGCKAPRRHGGDLWSVELIQPGEASIVGVVTDLQDGRYSVTFTPPRPGTYQVTARVKVQGSLVWEGPRVMGTVRVGERL